MTGRPRCAIHGPVTRRPRMYWWECKGWDGEGCWLPVVTEAKLLLWQVVLNPPSLLMIPVRPAGCRALPAHWDGMPLCGCPPCRRTGLSGPVRP